jgi:hypothetical protein
MNDKTNSPSNQDLAADGGAPSHEEISLVAYDLWRKAGSPSGRFMEFCVKAEQQIIAARKEQAGESTTSAPGPKASSPER